MSAGEQAAQGAVVIVNFGSHRLLTENFVDVARQMSDTLVVVVDNFSDDSERQSIRQIANAESWTLLTPEENLGFGAGANLGAARALALGCDALLFVNPDLAVPADVAQSLLERVRREPDVMVAPRICHPDGRLWFAGAQVDLRRGLTRSDPDVEQTGRERMLTGACLAVHRKTWRALGGFDPRYFLYWEDIDLSHRCLAAGGDIWVEHSLVATHDVGGTQDTAGGKSALYTYFNCRNRLLFSRFHLGRRDRLRWLLWAPKYAIRVVTRSSRSYLVRHPTVVVGGFIGTIAGAWQVLKSLPRGPVGSVPVLSTFDVFDTLLLRHVGEPSGLFLPLGRRLSAASLIDTSAEEFARIRVLAERTANSRSPGRQASLEVIYQQLGVMLELDAERLEQLIAAELHIESELITAAPGAIDSVDTARYVGAVAFVSDMYLPTAFVSALLDTHGLRHPGERVFVSADLGMTKRSGELFEYVLEELGAEPSQVLHVGDNRQSDVEAPRRLGIRTEHVADTALNRYERVLDQHRWDSAGLSAAFAGCSRIARLSTPAASEHERNVRDLSAGVVAPMLSGYVLWILQRAERLGIRRLLFVSRDGEVLLEIARRLAAVAGYDGELDYIYGSRHAWYPAGVDPDDPAVAIRGLRHATDSGLDVLLDRAGVDPADWLQDDLPGPSHSQDDALDRLIDTPGFLDAVRSGLQARQRRLESYALAAGLLEPSVGIVDLGWHGRSLDCLSRFLSERGGSRLTGFYMGLDAADSELFQATEVWLQGFEQRLRFIMIESFCVGSHGQVVDYDAARPVLKSPANRPAQAWGLSTLRRTVLSFADQLATVLPVFDVRSNVRYAVLESFDLFYSTPTSAEARAWGRFPFEVGSSASSSELLAPGRSLRKRLVDHRQGGVRLRWPAGDEALAPAAWRTIQLASRWLRRLRSLRP